MRILLCLLLATSLFAENTLTTHTYGTTSYTAEVASLPVKDAEENEKGQITYIAYTQEGAQRPITFVFNGGPGSSSVWLHLGAFGPKRVVSPEEGQSVAPPYQIIDNEESILDLTDLVFIDPIGTGFSRAKTAEDAKPYYDVVGDIVCISNFIRDYLTSKNRWNSPIYIAGESYGAGRACGLSAYLQTQHGIYPNGLILISSFINSDTHSYSTLRHLPFFLNLPTYAATAWHHGRYRPEASLEEVVAEAKDFSYNTYAPYLFRPCIDPMEKEELFARLAQLTGLPLSIIQREEGKIDIGLFVTAFFPSEKKKLSLYDTRCTGSYVYCFPLGLPPMLSYFYQDPSIASIGGIFSTALHHYLQNELKCPSSYTIFSEEANRQWTFVHPDLYNSAPDFIGSLSTALVMNPHMKLFFGSGYYDTVTPFTATDYCIDALHAYQGNIQSEYYEGGHMYYLNPSARKKFKADLRKFYEQ